MSVLSLKKLLKPEAKKSAPPIPASQPDPLAQKVDRLGQLKAILDPVKHFQEESDKLKKELVAALTPQGDPAGEIVFRGEHYTLVLGPRANERSVTDPGALYEVLGHQNFLAVMKPSLTELDKRLTSGDKERLIVVSPGNRKLKALVPISSTVH